jgi:membrane protease YdiL (CAAX protease family)
MVWESITYWGVLFFIGAATILGNFFYSWLIQKTRFYVPKVDLEARSREAVLKEANRTQIFIFILYNFIWIVVIAPIIEELIFREFLLWLTYSTAGFWLAALFSSVLWTLPHYWWSQPYILVVGVIYTWVWVEYGLLWCIILHLINNAIAFVITFYTTIKRIRNPRKTRILF